MIYAKPHAGYLISAVFIPLQEVTDYVVHEYFDPGVSAAVKMSKAGVINLIENSGMPVYVWQWDYDSARFVIGKQVNCALDYQQQKYLWINAKDPKTKDLKHLVKMNWFESVFRQ